MRTRQITIISILVLIFGGCSPNNQDDVEWKRIKNSSDFGAFFNFALKVTDPITFKDCADSLEKYKPRESCIILLYTNYYNLENDSLIYEDFELEDQCGIIYDYKRRNIIFISIDKYDSVKTHYLDSTNLDYKSILISLHDTNDITYELPEAYVITYDDEEYLQRIVVTVINSQMLPDTVDKTTSWGKLIEITKGILSTTEEIKDRKSSLIFDLPYNELLDDQKIFVDKLVPTLIEIHFDNYLLLPPPPLPSNRI